MALIPRKPLWFFAAEDISDWSYDNFKSLSLTKCFICSITSILKKFYLWLRQEWIHKSLTCRTKHKLFSKNYVLFLDAVIFVLHSLCSAFLPFLDTFQIIRMVEVLEISTWLGHDFTARAISLSAITFQSVCKQKIVSKDRKSVV